MRKLAFVLMFVIVPAFCFGSDKNDNKAPAAKIEEMAWLAGHWVGEGLGGISEESWSPPRAGSMMGMYRLIKDGEVNFYEFLTIVEKDNSLVLQLKHFTKAFTGWEEKDEHLSWNLKRIKRTGDKLHIQLWLQQKGERNLVEFNFKKMTD